MTPKTQDINAQVKVSFRLPEDLYDHYAERATKIAGEPESEMIKTLARCRTHNAASPIYVGDSARNKLSQLTGRLLRDEDALVAEVEKLVTTRVDGTNVTLSSLLLARLDSRCFGGITRADLLRQLVPELLEQWAGLR